MKLYLSNRFNIWIITLLAALLTGCQPGADQAGQKQQQPVSLTVSVASSLRDAMEEIKTHYRKENPQVTLQLNSGASGALQQQIEQDAPIDVFISASGRQMDDLEKKGLLINSTRMDLLQNKLVLVTPKDMTKVRGFQDLLEPDVKKFGIGAPAYVPAGTYAQEVLTTLGIWNQVQPKLVLANDARTVLAYVETGNADAGIVYSTDARTTSEVRIAAAAPESSHSPVIYPAAVLKRSKKTLEAMDLLSYLSREQAQGIFAKYGYISIIK